MPDELERGGHLAESEVFFDSLGNRLRISRGELAQRLGAKAAGPEPVDYAVQLTGFVCVRQTSSALVVEFQPLTVSHLAVVAAFYEIYDYEFTGRAPRTIELACGNEPDRSEVFRNIGLACRRIEALIKRDP